MDLQAVTERPPAASRLLAAVDESMRCGRTIFCPTCGQMHHTILFRTGAELPCSRCGLTLIVPEETSSILDIHPMVDPQV